MPIAPKPASRRRRVSAPDPVFETTPAPKARRQASSSKKTAPPLATVAAAKASNKSPREKPVTGGAKSYRKSIPSSSPTAASKTREQPSATTYESKFLVRPLPLRISQGQLDFLFAKRDQTGVPVQELIRRAIDYMSEKLPLQTVPQPGAR